MTRTLRIGLLGARGHVGAELLRLIARHPHLALGFVASREWAGQPLSAQLPGLGLAGRFENLDPGQVAASGVDVVVLAMPNGAARPYVEALDAAAPATLVVDLSADHRFDPDWYYGLPELTRSRYAGQRRISNPGCYATAMQLLLAPCLDLLEGPAQCFGVSGYSGAGTTPSPRNDPDALRDNLIPYTLVGHLHEREVSHQLGHPVEFMPHVAPHFRGLAVTANLHLREPLSLAAVRARYAQRYAAEPLVRLQEDPPWLSRSAARHGACLGGWSLAADGRRLVAVAALDNLLKGAATQALQNINLACGWDERTGIDDAN
ncbi:MAG: N-acetyl-gamma-glutamyl-phosphate reductase [Lysobacteraceae bacterium]|nr:MAG: N-acetyl-gamma-glutamyl-phosphate reductase [Xanthomonadaceae bacterium]